jgi:hypothetical protein
MGCNFDRTDDGHLRGWGVDPVGVFAISGLVSKLDERVAWTKKYIGQHFVRYSGASGPSTMHGLWFINPQYINAWALKWISDPVWQKPTGELISRGLTAWIEGDYEKATHSFVSASALEEIADVSLAAAALLEHLGSIQAAKDQMVRARTLVSRTAIKGFAGIEIGIQNALRRLGMLDSEIEMPESTVLISKDIAGDREDNGNADQLLLDVEAKDAKTQRDIGDHYATLHGGDPNLMNSIAWSMYLSDQELDAALDLARIGYSRGKSRFVAHTLCAILVRLGRWQEARPLFNEWMFGLGRSIGELRSRWNEQFRSTFIDAIRHGHAEDAADLLGELGDPLPWLRDQLTRSARGEDVLIEWPADESGGSAQTGLH